MKKRLFTWMLAVAAILTVASCSKPEERPDYIPDEEEGEVGGSTGREFYIFDCWSAYKGKPDDMSADKFSKCQLIYEAFLLGDDKEIDMAKVKQQAQLAKMTGVRYISTDIEEWYSTKNGEALKDGLLQVFNEFKKAIPDCVIGNYGVPVSDLNVRRYAASQIGKPENEIQAGWISASEKRMPAAEVSDALFPSMYTHTDGSNADPITQYEKDVKTTADYLKTNFPGKKIYAYIWPQFYNLHMSPNDSYKQFMTAEQWTRVLEVCYANFDGVILWGNGSGPDDQPVAWSDSRMQAIYAATKSFVSKYYDDIAVAAGATGGDVEIVPTEFEVFGDLGFNNTPRNLLKYGMQPINLIKESDVSEADKVDGVLPPNFSKIKHIAKNASLPVVFLQSTWISDRSTNNAAMVQRFADITAAFKSENKTVTLGYRGVGPTALTELAAWNDYSTEFARKDSWLRYAVEPCRALRQSADVICPVVTLINDDLDYWKSDCVSVFEEARLDNPGKKIYACLGTMYYGNPNKEGGFADMFTPIKEETLKQVLEYLYLRCDGIIFYDNSTKETKVNYSEDLGFMKAVAAFYANHKTVIDKKLPASVADEDDIPPYVEEENDEDKVYRESITNGSFEDEIVPTFVQADWSCHTASLVRLARLESYFDKTAAATRPTAPSGTTIADGTWFHRCNNNSYYWHNYIDNIDVPYAESSLGVPRAHTGKRSAAMYVADGAGESRYTSHVGNLQHLFGLGQTLSLNDKKTYTMKFWYYRPAKLWQGKENSVQKIMAGIVSSNGASKTTDYTYEQEFVLSKTDEWTECSITFNLPEIIKANSGKSFEKCAIFINIVPEIDPANENKTKRCLVNIDDVSMEVVE